VAELGVSSLLAGSVTLAQLVPDNTLGEESSVIAPGLVDGLPADLVEGGAARGTNLFHSFESFNIDGGQRLYFANPAGITDILSRVTGGNVSNINGLLGVDGSANLFLLNPNGILFGPEAELDLRGSFLASTGDSFIFGNGELFSATEPGSAPLLSVSVPLGVQYGLSPGSITASGSILAAPSSETLALIGGDIDLDFVQITAPSGQIEIGAVADTIISIDNSSNGLSVDIPTDFSGRDIRIIDSEITTYPEDFGDTGNLEIIGGTAIISGSYLETSTEDGNAGDLLIGVDDSLIIDFSELFSDVLSGTGAGGNLQVSAGSSLIIDSVLQSSVLDEGEAGNIFISVDDLLTIDFSEIYSDVIIGEGGDIKIDAGSAEIIDTIIESSTLEGNAGNLDIIIDNTLLVDESNVLSNVLSGSGNGGQVQISSGSAQFQNSTIFTSAVQGDAGNLNITANGTLELNDTQLYSNASFGSGGDISLLGNLVSILNKSRISTSVDAGQGDSGSISIAALDFANIENSEIVSGIPQGVVGESGNVSISGNSVSIYKSVLNNILSGEGSGGNITLDSRDTISIQDSVVFNNVATGGIGDGGDIELSGNSVYIYDSQLQAQTDGLGDSGDIAIRAIDLLEFVNSTTFNSVFDNAEGSGGNLEIETGSLIIEAKGNPLGVYGFTATTSGQGDGGDITIRAQGNVIIRSLRTNNLRPTLTLRSDVLNRGEGIAGDIDIRANSIFFDGGALINGVDGGGAGGVGQIRLVANERISLDSGGIFNNIGRDVMASEGGIFISTSFLEVLNGSQIFASTDGEGDGGQIFIDASEGVLVDGIGEDRVIPSSIFSSSESEATGSGGVIAISSPLVRLSNSGVVNARTLSASEGGDIIINADTFEAISGGQVVTSSQGSGQAGDIRLNVRGEILLTGLNENYEEFLNNPRRERGDNQGPESGLFATTDSSGAAGNITLQPHGNGQTLSVTLAEGAQITASTAENSTGQGGSVRLSAPQQITLSGDGQISVETSGSGVAGNVLIQSPTLTLQDGVQISSTANATATPISSGGGQFTVNASNLNLLGTGGLFAETEGDAPAGTFNFRPYGADQNLSLTFAQGSQITASTAENSTGRGGSVTLTAPQQITLAGNGQISVETSGTGPAGNILIESPTVTLRDGVQISSTANATATPTESIGGQFTVNASNLNLLGTGGLFAETEGDASAGSVFLRPYGNGSDLTVSFQNDAQISTSTNGPGSGGNISLTAPERLTIQGNGRLSSETSGTGSAGNLDVTTGDLTIQNGATLSVSSSAVTPSANPDLAFDSTAGPAGNININARSVRLTDQASLQASTASGEGGNINLQVADTLVLRRNSSISTEAGGSGNGGNITATAGFIVTAPEENNDIIANAVAGSGGRVSLTANRILGFTPRSGLTTAELRSNTSSDLSASSELGTEGDVEVANLAVDPSQGLSELPVTFSDTSNQIAQGCRATATSAQSEFVVTGRGGLPTSPADPPTADIEPIPWATQNLSPAEGDATSHGVTPEMTAPVTEVPEIVEAQGWVRDANGDVVFVAAPTVASPQPSDLVTADLCPGQAPQNQE
jgi:filamentous hemagglutinin family protein